MTEQVSESSIEEVLRYMGMDSNSSNRIRYDHMRDSVDLVKQNSGQTERRIENLAGTRVGVSKRTFREFMEYCEEWGIILRKDSRIQYMGIPKGGLPKEKPPPEKGKPFRGYDAPPERPSV